MLRAIIIDDEEAGIQTLRLLTERYSGGIKIIGSSTDPFEGIQMVDDFRPDILFLDISMPIMNGFELFVETH
jgi:two-component system LytT family response regulator